MSMYPKTVRYEKFDWSCQITEKLDGSNIGFGMSNTKKFFVFFRNSWTTLDFKSEKITYDGYPGLTEFVSVNADQLSKICPGSVVFGEWISKQSKTHKTGEHVEHGFYMFAKCRIQYGFDLGYGFKNLSLESLNYDVNNFMYAWGGELPGCIKTVPVVLNDIPVFECTAERLDQIYQQLSKERPYTPEGLIIAINNKKDIVKFVKNKIVSNKEGDLK